MEEKNISERLDLLERENRLLKVFVYLIIAVFLVSLGASGFWLYQKNRVSKERDVLEQLPSFQENISPTEIIGSPTAEPTTAPTIQTKSDLELIKEAFSQEFERPISEVNVTINKNIGTHASGGVKFEGEMGGGWFLAAKTADGWIIADSGNGTVTCEKIEPYNFPSSMVPECYTEDGRRIVR